MHTYFEVYRNKKVTFFDLQKRIVLRNDTIILVKIYGKLYGLQSEIQSE
jgi:hypothetical protein